MPSAGGKMPGQQPDFNKLFNSERGRNIFLFVKFSILKRKLGIDKTFFCFGEE